MKLNRLSTIFFAMFLCLFMASTAMAFDVRSRSAEMNDFTECDRAGTIEYRFTENDYNQIAAYLADPANNYVRIRVTLGGTNLPANPRLPVLCQNIRGLWRNVTPPPAGYNYVPIPRDRALQLTALNITISDVLGSGAPDFDVFVHGTAGNQFLEIFITAHEDFSAYLAWDTNPPWFKVGVYEDVNAYNTAGGFEPFLPGTTDPDYAYEWPTPICVDARDFGGLTTLTISNEALPQSLTFSGDNQIGHFLAQSVLLRNCVKDEYGNCADTSTIYLCGVEQETLTGQKCFVAIGDMPDQGDVVLNVRTNGATTGAVTQSGIYLNTVTVTDINGNVLPILWERWTAGGLEAPVGSRAQWYTATIDASVIAQNAQGQGYLKFCVGYEVDPTEAAVDTNVRIWPSAAVLPCGNIFSGVVTGAMLRECGADFTSSIYFPYIVQQAPPWFTGIAITNLGASVAPADMEATFTLTDSTGAVFTYTKTDFTTVVWAAVVDGMLANFNGTPAPGWAWLKVDTNFSVDGYQFMSDGVFGAGTLARD